MSRTGAEYLTVIGLTSIASSVFLGFVVAGQSDFFGAIDAYVHNTLALTPSSKWLPYILLVSGIGGFWSIATLTSITALWLIITSRLREALSWIFSIGIAGTLSETLKYFFLLDRPLEKITEAISPAYPSGHATAISVLATLAFLSFSRYIRNRSLRVIYFLACAATILAISLSRIILHAHWFSDVFGGILLGSGIALAVFGLGQLYTRKRK